LRFRLLAAPVTELDDGATPSLVAMTSDPLLDAHPGQSAGRAS